MSRSLRYLRRGLLGIAFVGSLGFGVSAAFAQPEVPNRERECGPGQVDCCGVCISKYQFCGLC
jgi:hypothetical protein